MNSLPCNRVLKVAVAAALVLGGCGSPPPPPPAIPAAEGAGKTVNMKAVADQHESPSVTDLETTGTRPSGK